MTIKIGLMGFGQIGRQIYKRTLASDAFDIVAISDIGQPEILCHLLDVTLGHRKEIALEGNYLVGTRARTRIMSADRPGEIPWDIFGVDVVIDVTGRFRSTAELEPHLDNGAPRVISSTLPREELDRVVLYGVNENEALASDRIISAGSASTTGAALLVKVMAEQFTLEHASMTSVHSYTSDQSLADYAGADYRRSRSGAENIIPNETPALTWVQRVLPDMAGKMTAYALNVPIQSGSMLDVTFALRDPLADVTPVHEAMTRAAARLPDLIETTTDPIVSCDVRGNTHSLLVDLDATMLAGKRMVKIIAWHESLAHAQRVLDIVAHYDRLDQQQENVA